MRLPFCLSCTSRLSCLVLALLGCLVLVGCSARGAPFAVAEATSDEALVYVYRPSAGALRARTAIVVAPGHEELRLSNNGHVLLRLAPGRQRITQHWAPWLLDDAQIDQPIVRDLELQAGQRYFLRLASTFRRGEELLVVRWALEEVPQAQALDEISPTRRQ